VKAVPIGELTEPVKTWNPSREPDSEFEYIDLSAVDNSSKRVTGATPTVGSAAPSRARQLVAAGDVLVSTVRPNLNAVAVVPPGLDGATASTGFTVLRAGHDLDGRYLFHWVQSPAFIGDMVRKATGASYPAVSDRIIRGSQIPTPPLPEQRRIAAILDHADADESMESVDFGSVANLAGGRNLVAADSASQTPYRVLKISAVTTGQFKPHESKPLPSDYTPPTDHLVRAGDLLMSRANTTELVGAVAYVSTTPPNLALPDKVWRFQWKGDAEPIFYQALFSTPAIRRRISRLSSGTGGSMKNVSKAKLETMPLPRVAVERQRDFVSRAQRVAEQRGLLGSATVAENKLFASLQSRAFRGEL
jgi:type I restriction enzyme S subunit